MKHKSWREAEIHFRDEAEYAAIVTAAGSGAVLYTDVISISRLPFLSFLLSLSRQLSNALCISERAALRLRAVQRRGMPEPIVRTPTVHRRGRARRSRTSPGFFPFLPFLPLLPPPRRRRRCGPSRSRNRTLPRRDKTARAASRCPTRLGPLRERRRRRRRPGGGGRGSPPPVPSSPPLATGMISFRIDVRTRCWSEGDTGVGHRSPLMGQQVEYFAPQILMEEESGPGLDGGRGFPFVPPFPGLSFLSPPSPVRRPQRGQNIIDKFE